MYYFLCTFLIAADIVISLTYFIHTGFRIESPTGVTPLLLLVVWVSWNCKCTNPAKQGQGEKCRNFLPLAAQYTYALTNSQQRSRWSHPFFKKIAIQYSTVLCSNFDDHEIIILYPLLNNLGTHTKKSPNCVPCFVQHWIFLQLLVWIGQKCPSRCVVLQSSRKLIHLATKNTEGYSRK